MNPITKQSRPSEHTRLPCFNTDANMNNISHWPLSGTHKSYYFPHFPLVGALRRAVMYLSDPTGSMQSLSPFHNCDRPKFPQDLTTMSSHSRSPNLSTFSQKNILLFSALVLSITMSRSSVKMQIC